uniref:pyruvate kinase n=1 Tax=Ananas comosus var. bracteatus TaxID=296719 RepID=A0A6V7PCU8_ANACO|nr:unnamed protein product [Ananas comosus var. bracteatus]
MTSSKVRCNLSQTYKFPSSSTKLRYQPKHLTLKQRENPTYPALHFKLKSENEPEGHGWKICIYSDNIDGATQDYVTNKHPENLFLSSSSDRDEELEAGMSLLKQVPSWYSANISVNLLDKLKAVRLWLLASEHRNFSQLKLCHRIYLPSATNLTHYLALQLLSIEELNENLSSVGLLCLKSSCPCILPSINYGIRQLENFIESDTNVEDVDRSDCSISMMRKRVSSHAIKLFGPAHEERNFSIMVTVGRESISNETLISNLLKAGANVFRINCAHDDPNVWSEIVRKVKANSQMLEKPCRILMDLAGPKPRTELLMRETNVFMAPKIDTKGDMIPSAHFWVCSMECSSPPPPHFSPGAVICVDRKLIDGLKEGDFVSILDGIDKKSSLRVVLKCSLDADDYGFIVECSRATCIGVGSKLYFKRGNKKHSLGQVVKLLKIEKFVILKAGDSLTISRFCCTSVDEPNCAVFDSNLARISCTSDHLFDGANPGEPIAFDDGRIWGKIRKKKANEITVLITHASPTGSKLGSGKSINTPRSEVKLRGLTPRDLVDLEFIASHADMVGISFIRDVEDIQSVRRALDKKGAKPEIGIVLKIETKEAYERLPILLFEALKYSNPVGIMIARGDLMIECGWEQMAEVQEGIMSVCAAAHVPVVWATQVLETLVKSGRPTRAEITDAATGMRLSCVMLNKGDHIAEAVCALNSMLSNRSSEKKIAMTNPLIPPSRL